MFGQKFFPYSTLQELNLDWILTKVKNILRFVPDDGYVGQILRRTKDGAEWSDEQGGGGAVNSVNGQTGTVVLTASDVGALPDSYTAPVTSVNTKTGAVVLDKSDVGLGNVANVAQYSDSNPPPYPVTSVNTKTGAVVLDKTDVGLGNVANEAQYSASNPPPYPVTSVNGQTGAATVNIRWVSYTATSDAWGQIVIPANVVAPTEEVIAVKTIGCYSTPIALTDTRQNWVLTVLQNNNANLTPWSGLYTVIYIGIFEG